MTKTSVFKKASRPVLISPTALLAVNAPVQADDPYPIPGPALSFLPSFLPSVEVVTPTRHVLPGYQNMPNQRSVRRRR